MAKPWVLLVLVVCACGTYSTLRPADTLARHEIELTGGVAANSLGEVNPVGQVALGVVDRIELVGQYELSSALGLLRFGLLTSLRHGLALAVGLGGGTAYVAANDLNQYRPAAIGELTLGHRLGRTDFYAGARFFLLFPDYAVLSTRAGIRLPLGAKLRLILEGGAATHFDAGWGVAQTLAEGTAGLALSF